MKKLLSEEKPVLKTAHINSKILIIVLLLSQVSFSQIPINGFCKINKFYVPSDCTNLISLNYDKDSYTDLLLFNPLKKESFLFRGEPNLKFSQATAINFPFEPTNFKPVYDSLFQISYYAFTSRKGRMFGTLTFNDKGIPKIIHSVKLNYYPDFIDVAVLTDSDRPVFIISGESFDGISMLKFVNNKFEEEKIISGTSFSFAQFVHLNGNDIIDIIGYNLFDKSLYFLINNGMNQFTVSRKLTFTEHINSLHIFDINADSFEDIIYTYNEGIKVIFGDPLYQFEKSTSISTNYNADNLSIGDFNHDGLFDLLYFSRKDGIISALFAKSSFSFYDEVEYLKTSSVAEIVPFFSKFVYGAAYITDDGEVGILSEVNSFKDDVALALSILPEGIILFDYNNNGINDFAIVDNKSKQLKFILRNNFGIPAYYFSIKYFGNNNKLIYFDKGSSEKIFYLYSLNERLIEIFYINFSNYSVQRENLYSEGKIVDVMISTSAEEKPNIHLLYKQDNKLKYVVYAYSSIKYNLINYPEISGEWFDALILNPYRKIIAYWQRSGNQYQLKFTEFLLKTLREKVVYSLNSERKVNTYSIKTLLSENLFLYSTVVEDYSKLWFIIYNQNISVFTRKNVAHDYKNTASPIKISFGNDNLLYFYSEALKNLSLIFNNRYYNKLNIKSVAENINIKKFVVTRLDTRNKHLIYIDSKDNLVKVKKIS